MPIIFEPDRMLLSRAYHFGSIIECKSHKESLEYQKEAKKRGRKIKTKLNLAKKK